MHAATWESLNRFAEHGELGMPAPHCEIRAPRRAVATQRVQFEVTTDPGTQVRACLQWTEGDSLLNIDASGRGSFVPARPGTYRILVQASNEWPSAREPGSSQAEAAITVVAPPVAIELAPRVVRGAPGSTACFRWDVKGADRIELRAPRRDQVIAMPARGGIDIDIDVLAESFQLIAVGMDGVEHEIDFATDPVVRLDANVDAVLGLLELPWS